MRPVLYYVHHQGLGHWRRALAVAGALSRPVIFASSTPPPQDLPSHTTYLWLPPDHPDSAGGTGHDVRGRLHWAPSHQPGLLRRHQLLLQEAVARTPVLAVVDVSVEVTVMLRTSGIPVLAVRLPGARTDQPHLLGFGLADHVLMPVPAEWGLHQALARTRSIGLVGAHTGSPATTPAAAPTPAPTPAPATSARPAKGLVVVVVGTGGSRLVQATCELIAADLPDHDVRVLGLPAGAGRASNLTFAGRIADPRPDLHAASVVIGNAGLGTISDVAGARRPFVTIPEARPFGEQDASARALSAHGPAVVLRDLPAPGGWPAVIEAALAAGPLQLATDGAARFAAVIEEFAGDLAGLSGVAKVPPPAQRAPVTR